jgi:hypothetical protein
MTPAEQDRQALAAAIEENHRLRAEAARRVDDNRVTPNDTTEDVAVALVGMFTRNKAQTIARRVLAILGTR